jgi:hypothetical protein
VAKAREPLDRQTYVKRDALPLPQRKSVRPHARNTGMRRSLLSITDRSPA